MKQNRVRGVSKETLKPVIDKVR